MVCEALVAFDAVARRQPRAIAISTENESVSYEQLEARSRSLGERFVAEGVRPGDVVALSVGRSADHVAAMLAAWRAGAAFLPVDPSAPEARVNEILTECRARLLVEREGLRRLTMGGEPLGAADDGLAYVIYTSGSTGRPKGVRISHRGLLPLLSSQIRAFALGPGKRALLYLSLAFDASISDIGTALLSGATLVVASSPPSPRELPGYLEANGITHADLPPSLLPLVDPRALPASLEVVVIGGEACVPAAARAWAERVRVVNVYGPTEATICTSLCECDAGWERPLLGEPLDHVHYRVEDDELLIAGPALALGYVASPELEAARFVMREGVRHYRTGDRVHRHDDGSLEFKGRLDRQVKLRGRLISPEEIEARLLEMEGVEAASVVAVGERPVLTAFVVSGLAPVTIRRRLEKTLPGWMLPRVVVVPALPGTESGKVDRRAIVQPGTSREGDPRVRAIAEAFERVLGGAGDFDALGGDSLAAVEIAAAAELSGVCIEPSEVMRAKTPEAIARTGCASGRSVGELRDVAERLAMDLPAATSRDGQAHDWLVTGATGFLGARLLSELLDRTDARIHCIVRARSDDEARRRLPSSPRIVAYAGDLTSPGFGLDAERYRALSLDVGHVLHSAAVVNLVSAYEALARPNVQGALEVARFVRCGAHKVLHHISSLAVLVATDDEGRAIDERTVLPDTRRVFGGYAQTKFVAEEALKRAVPGVRIVRPGLLTGDTVDGVGAPSCQLTAFLRGVAALGCIPEGAHDELRLDVTPVDHAARAIADSDDVLTHVASRDGVSLAAVLRALRHRGSIEVTSASEFRRRAREQLPPDAAMALLASSYRLLGGDAHRESDLFLMTGRRFDSRSNAPAADDRLLGLYVDAALGASA